MDDFRKGATHYQYDALNQLKTVKGFADEEFDFDPAGNLLSTDKSSSVESSTQVKGNRLLFQGDRKFSYDTAGNLVKENRGKGGSIETRYRYNSQNQLTAVDNGKQVSRYAYDALGRRVFKEDVFGKTDFLWNGDVLLSEKRGQSEKIYLYEPGSFRPLAQVQDGKIYHYHLDHLGTPQEMTDNSGAIVWSASYKAYGNLALNDVNEVENNLRFQGQYFDCESGLHYNRHRYYNPNSARFINQDPVGLIGGDNNYQYAANPTGWVDPLGLTAKEPGCGSKNTTNSTGESVSTYPGHEWSPIDPNMNEPPIYVEGPFTTEQRGEFLKGNSAGTKLSPHHRHQIPVETHGGVIDEIPGPGHPSGNIHTKKVDGQARHVGASYFRNTEGGETQRSREIRDHWKTKGNRLIEDPDAPGEWIDPGTNS